jgi:glycosyltransferase involved in cell wall biosynthesis
MGQEGRRRVLSLFSWRKAALETLRVYERVLSGSD